MATAVRRSPKAIRAQRSRIQLTRAGSMPKRGLYANINAKRKRIAAGSNERMRKPGSKGAPSAQDFKKSAKTAKKKKGKK
jgi:hypothetical protein